MSFIETYDILDAEVKELLQNYKHKKATGYEPCTLENIKLQLLRLSEEFDLLNINYVFNPYIDINDNTLEPGALVNLINSIWILLHFYKNSNEKVERLLELEQNNKQLNAHVTRLKEKINLEKNEAKACVASAQKIADRSDMMLQTLTETRAKLLKVTKQKAASEKNLQNEIARLKLEIQKLSDRLRNKDCKPCSDSCDTTLLRLKEKEKQHRATIAQLQTVNQDLLHQILDLKEDLLLSGLNDVNINK